MAIDLSFCRAEFPCLSSVKVAGQPAAYFDGPGGTQVPQRVLDAMTDYLIHANANAGQASQTSVRSDAIIARARQALADLLGASSAEEIALGPNMTTLNFNLARALARDLQPGDEVMVTELDHEANVSPWLTIAEDKGATVRWVRVDTGKCTLDLQDLEAKLSPRTKILAVGLASNATGTVNDVARIARMAKAVGATVIVDAVHGVPHMPVDVKALGCDFLLCSVYKFFGPHVGVLWGRPEAFAALRTYKVRPQYDKAPYKIETGTLNHEGIAGSAAAIDFIADIGRTTDGSDAPLAPVGTPERRQQLLAGLRAIEEHEAGLLVQLLEGLARIPGLKTYGPPAGQLRTPTVSFTLDGVTPSAIAAALAEKAIFCSAGSFYANTVIDRLGLLDSGGVVRVGLAPYNTADEVDRLVQVVTALAR
jgi:cysteine desulfurase family protein (TIGR01976 family)